MCRTLAKTRLFFVTDVHGSDRCFRKFINAGKFYNAGVLVLGGDITGKMIVPIVKEPDGSYKCEFGGTHYDLKSQDQLNETVKGIKDSGFYPHVTEPKEVEELWRSPSSSTSCSRSS